MGPGRRQTNGARLGLLKGRRGESSRGRRRQTGENAAARAARSGHGRRQREENAATRAARIVHGRRQTHGARAAGGTTRAAGREFARASGKPQTP